MNAVGKNKIALRRKIREATEKIRGYWYNAQGRCKRTIKDSIIAQLSDASKRKIQHPKYDGLSWAKWIEY